MTAVARDDDSPKEPKEAVDSTGAPEPDAVEDVEESPRPATPPQPEAEAATTEVKPGRHAKADEPDDEAEPDTAVESDIDAESDITVIPEQPAGPDEAFAKFAPAEEEEPKGWRRVRRGIGRFFIHEWTLAALGSIILAVAMTWPTLKYPAHTIPQDTGDPTLVAWMLAWSGHAVKTDIANLWHANAFYPEQFSYAFTDTLLGYFPAGLIGDGFQAALLRYNIIYVLLHALAFFGAYVLVRQLGSGRTGALVAGAAFAYAPWRLVQAGHVHVISTGGIALTLAMLARGHGFSLRHGYRPERRKPLWALAGWLTAAWQISLGFGIGLPFGYVLAIITLVSLILLLVKRFRHGPFPFGGKLFVADLVGGMIFAAVAVLMALPYLKVAQLHPYAVRSEAEVGAYSPPLRGFFISPAESAIWGDAHAPARESLSWVPEMTMLPGFVLYGLAAAGLIMSIWTLRQRILLGLGVALSIFLAMGTNPYGGGRPGYLTLYDFLPGWDALRTPGRLVIWTTLLLAILAAGAVSALVEQSKLASINRVPSRPHPLLRVATFIPVVLVLGEGLNNTPHPTVPPPPPSVVRAEGPVLVLPSDQLRDLHVMLWLTYEFQKTVNGGSGFTPQRTQEVREVTKQFPDATSVGMLRELGVKTVVVLRAQVVGTPYESALTAPVEGLGVERKEFADAVVFTLGQSGSPR
ncbi:hypothetical protein [Allorhizocola rhizosphaerae]|uniref:hypothetical protein n=1 Tax=Allorhizocola rhizosphaerae TaxID=1872709 RepID=UPI001FE67B32|nr:hypothetical protein [Allorhizocola rhizosphaerae]